MREIYILIGSKLKDSELLGEVKLRLFEKPSKGSGSEKGNNWFSLVNLEKRY